MVCRQAPILIISKDGKDGDCASKTAFLSKIKIKKYNIFNLDNSTNPSLGETLLQDIQQFLNKSSGVQSDSGSQQSNPNVKI